MSETTDARTRVCCARCRHTADYHVDADGSLAACGKIGCQCPEFGLDAPTPAAPAPAVPPLTNYVRVWKWSQCWHCKAVFAGEHFCGAPWQADPGEGIDGVSQAWRAEMPRATLAAAERRAEEAEAKLARVLELNDRLCRQWEATIEENVRDLRAQLTAAEAALAEARRIVAEYQTGSAYEKQDGEQRFIADLIAALARAPREEGAT